MLLLMGAAHGLSCSLPDFPVLDSDGDGHLDRDDCEPLDPDVYPGAQDFYGDGKDQDCDCDGVEGAGDGTDLDCDGFPGANVPLGFEHLLDCDDDKPHVHPGADDVCDDALDNDCDGVPDPSERDIDEDGWSSCAGDCDDADPRLNPGADEGCDGLDTDCDGVPGDGEIDEDGDGFLACAECDDSRAETHPDAAELCDGEDNDCDGEEDEGTETDDDGDGMTECQGDCDDLDGDTYTAAPEVCDGVDNDCDGDTPADETDADLDGYRICAGDCDDGAIRVSPGATEICGNSTDDNCDGDTDSLGCADCTYWVPGDFDDLSTALDVDGGVASGDTVCVSEGEYTENLSFRGLAVHLVGAGGPTVTTVDGGGVDSVVRFDHAEGADSVLEGFTLRNGDAEANSGGGITIHWSSPTLRNLVVTDNRARTGGGIYLNHSSAHISDVEVSGNEVAAVGGFEGHGGGMYLFGSDATFEDLHVHGNEANMHGGGIFLIDSSPSLHDVTVEDNHAATGGGMYCSDANPVLMGVTLEANEAAVGGGIYMEGSSSPTGDRVVVRDNEAVTMGGGMSVWDESAPALRNVLLQANSCSAGYGGGLYMSVDGGTFENVVFLGNYSWDEGGGAYFHDCVAPGPSFTNALFLANHAVDSGGGFKASQSTLRLVNATVAGNTTDGWGAGVYLESESSIELTNVATTLNVADTDGDGFGRGGMIINNSFGLLNHCQVWGNEPGDYCEMHDIEEPVPRIEEDPLLLDTSGLDHATWDVHLTETSPLVDAGDPTLLDPDGSRSDIGVFGGPLAGSFDLDGDGFPLWWFPGEYDAASTPETDCDDFDPTVHPGAGC